MLAELHGKLDPEVSLPAERSEDLLTDAVFGALRHLPYETVLSKILTLAGVTVGEGALAKAEVSVWPAIPAHDMSGRMIEPDVVVVAADQVVVFENKLYSEFGPTLMNGVKVHQLAMQYAAVSAWAKGQKLSIPVIVAVTRGPHRPAAELASAAADIGLLMGEGVQPRWLSWHAIAECLAAITGLARHDQAHVDDVLALMERRGVRRMFQSLPMEDYWLVTAAQRVAADRLYPQLKTFFDELRAVLETDGIDWAQPNQGMWLGPASTHVDRPADWVRGFVGGLYWPKAAPERNGTGLALYGLFDFIEPGFEAGLTIQRPGAAAALQKWGPYADALADSLQSLAGYDVVLDTGSVVPRAVQSAAGSATADWLKTVFARLTGPSRLRICRRAAIPALTVQVARTMITTVNADLAACAPLWEMLSATGHVGNSTTMTSPGLSSADGPAASPEQ